MIRVNKHAYQILIFTYVRVSGGNMRTFNLLDEIGTLRTDYRAKVNHFLTICVHVRTSFNMTHIRLHMRICEALRDWGNSVKNELLRPPLAACSVFQLWTILTKVVATVASDAEIAFMSLFQTPLGRLWFLPFPFDIALEGVLLTSSRCADNACMDCLRNFLLFVSFFRHLIFILTI